MTPGSAPYSSWPVVRSKTSTPAVPSAAWTPASTLLSTVRSRCWAGVGEDGAGVSVGEVGVVAVAVDRVVLVWELAAGLAPR